MNIVTPSHPQLLGHSQTTRTQDWGTTKGHNNDISGKIFDPVVIENVINSSPDNSSVLLDSHGVDYNGKISKPVNTVDLGLYNCQVSNVMCFCYSDVDCMDMHVTPGPSAGVSSTYHVTDSKGCQQNLHMIKNYTKTIAGREAMLNLSQVMTKPISCTIDVTNIYLFDHLNTCINYDVYLHKNLQQKPSGFYVLQISYLRGHMCLMQCSHAPAGPLWILSTMNFYIKFHITQFNHAMSCNETGSQ